MPKYFGNLELRSVEPSTHDRETGKDGSVNCKMHSKTENVHKLVQHSKQNRPLQAFDCRQNDNIKIHVRHMLIEYVTRLRRSMTDSDC